MMGLRYSTASLALTAPDDFSVCVSPRCITASLALTAPDGSSVCVSPRFHHRVNETFVLLRRYAAQIGSHRHFRTTSRSHIKEPNSPVINRRFGTKYRYYLHEPKSRNGYLTAWPLKMGPIFCPETLLTTNLHCVTSQKSENLNSSCLSVRVHEIRSETKITQNIYSETLCSWRLSREKKTMTYYCT
jgi:hypothetical protein